MKINLKDKIKNRLISKRRQKLTEFGLKIEDVQN